MHHRQKWVATAGSVSEPPMAVLLLVSAAAVLVRLIAALVLDGFRHPHLEEYDLIARNMLAGRGFTYPHHGITYFSYIAPLPAWLSAASYWLTGSLALHMALQILAGALLAVAAALLARRIFGGTAAMLAAGVLVAVHPGLIVYSASRAHSLPFDALLFTLAVLQAIRVAERPTHLRAATLGLVVGLGILSRATVLLALPVAAAWILLVRPTLPRRKALGAAALAGVCAAVVVAPWSVRNSQLHGRFVFLVTTDGEVFWRGNNPSATGTSHIDAERTVLSALSPVDVQELHRQRDEIAQSEWFRARALKFIREHPDAFVGLTLRKFLYFWWYASTTGLLYPPGWFQLYLAYYVTALLLAAVGSWSIAVAGGRPAQYALLIGLILVAVSSFQSLFYVEGRHRWAVEPMILVMSGGGVAALLARRAVPRLI